MSWRNSPELLDVDAEIGYAPMTHGKSLSASITYLMWFGRHTFRKDSDRVTLLPVTPQLIRTEWVSIESHQTSIDVLNVFVNLIYSESYFVIVKTLIQSWKNLFHHN